MKTAPSDNSDKDTHVQTFSANIVDRLRDEIVDGGMKPGSRLRAHELREKFGVSLTPVREALIRLSSEGLVVGEDHRGFKVAPLSLKNLREITLLRELVEGTALRLSIENADLDWESELVAELHRLEVLSSRRDNHAEINTEWEQAHRRFHRALISNCDMPLLMSFCRIMQDLADRYRRIFLPVLREVDRSAEHAAIAKAACDRDADLAIRLLSEHIRHTENLVNEAYERHGDADG